MPGPANQHDRPVNVADGTSPLRASPNPRPRDAHQASIAEWLTAKAMLAGARAQMDEYAQQIFDLWLSGRAAAEVTFEDEKWASYMRTEKRLQQQIHEQLSAHAELLRDQVDGSPGRLQSPFSLSFHAEVGSQHGEFRTGYDVLHGSNRSAGDFVITGRFTAVRSGPSGSAYVVAYEDLSFVFNDIVNINKKYNADIMFERVAANIARCLGTGPPKDYILHVKWRAESPMTIEVAAKVKGQAPRWLKQFPNK